MPLSDDADLRAFLSQLYPELVIDGVAAASGQRVVYFCHFTQPIEPEHSRSDWHSWGAVVLKVSEGLSAQVVAYFQREIEILNTLNHPGYPNLLFDEVISDDPITEDRLRYRRFITIEERIESQPLSAVRERFNSEKSVIDLLLKIVTVLKPLWEWDPPLIHRDLKPENILITPNNDVVVIDLGIVREEGSAGVTASSASFGPCTPRYASPEQAKNEKRNISFRSDVFSLGTLCYELMTGENPFDHGTELIDEVLANVIAKNPEPLSSKCACSEEFSNLINKTMEKQPYKRYRKIDDLITVINQVRGLTDD